MYPKDTSILASTTFSIISTGCGIFTSVLSCKESFVSSEIGIFVVSLSSSVVLFCSVLSVLVSSDSVLASSSVESLVDCSSVSSKVSNI